MALFYGHSFQFYHYFLHFFFEVARRVIIQLWDSLEIPCRGHAAMALCLRWKRDESRLSAILLTAVSSLNETPSNCCVFFFKFLSELLKTPFCATSRLMEDVCCHSVNEFFRLACALPSIKCSSHHFSMCSGWEFLWLIRIVLRKKNNKTKEKTSLCLIFPEMGIQSVSTLVLPQMYFPLSSERRIFSAFSSGFDLKIQPFMPNEIPITFNAGNFRWTLAIFHVPRTEELSGTDFWK